MLDKVFSYLGLSKPHQEKALIAFQLLSDDVQSVILAFLPITSIYHFSLVSRKCAVVAYDEEYVWKEVASRYTINYSDEEGVQWRSRVKQAVKFCFEPKCIATDTLLVLTDLNRTVTCIQQEKNRWETIHMKTILSRGRIWTWEYELTWQTKFGAIINISRLFVGIERSDYDFKGKGDRIMGCHSSGVSFDIGERHVHSIEKNLATSKSVTMTEFESGDVITVVMDMKTSDRSNTMKMYKNGEWFVTVRNIPNGDNWVWYPAIAVLRNMVVSVRGGTQFDLRGEPEYNASQ